jgi:hypothetical protein
MDPAHHTHPDLGRKTQVQEPRPGHLARRDPRIVCKPRRQCLGNGAGRLACGLGQHHGGVRRHVAMPSVAGRLDSNTRRVQPGRQGAIGREGVEGRNHGGTNIGVEVHHSPVLNPWAMPDRPHGVNVGATRRAGAPPPRPRDI